jgi:hypothetical protein
MLGAASWVALLFAAAVPTSAPSELERGIQLLAGNDIPAAVVVLSGVRGPLALEDVVRLDENLGVALAYAGKSAEAERRFGHLLAVEPGHVLPYSISPKATFVFEKVRREMAQRRATEALLETPAAAPFDREIALALTCRANALDLVASWQVCHRVKGSSADYQCVNRPGLPIGETATVTLPAVPASAAVEPAATAPDKAPAVLQVALAGLDAQGNEVFRNPSRAQPREIPIGIAVPGPWYGNVWLWAAVGVVAIAAASGTAVAIWALQPATARVVGEVQ